MQGHFVMKNNEANKIEVLERLKRKEIKQSQAAELLGISARQVRRTLKKYELEGAKGLIHKGRGKQSNRKISQETIDKTIKIISKKYRDFGPTLAHEKLIEDHKLKLSLSTVRSQMVSVGLWKSKKRRVAHVHQLRERRSCFGEMIQLDGSPHDWFEGRGDKCNLNVSVDDATSIFSFRFSKVETTQDYFRLVEEYFNQYGLPLAFYVDKHSIFRVNTPVNLDLRKPTKDKYEGLTQFGRAMAELGIELIFANTPQAKGRVERVNQTLQDRLVKEMRLDNISSIKEANKFLPKFIKKFNKRFSAKPKSKINMHRKLDKSIDLSKILCIKETRVVSKNLTLQYNNTIFQIKTKRSAYTLRKTTVTICERHDGTTTIWDSRGKPLDYTTIKKLPSTKATNSKLLNNKMDAILVKQAKNNFKKRNPWESDFDELTNDNYYYKPIGAV